MVAIIEVKSRFPPVIDQHQQQSEEQTHPQAGEDTLADDLAPGLPAGDPLHQLQVRAHDQGALDRELIIRQGVHHRLHLLVGAVHPERARVLQVVQARGQRGLRTWGLRGLAHGATVEQEGGKMLGLARMGAERPR